MGEEAKQVGCSCISFSFVHFWAAFLLILIDCSAFVLNWYRNKLRQRRSSRRQQRRRKKRKQRRKRQRRRRRKSQSHLLHLSCTSTCIVLDVPRRSRNP
jgi:thiosulfate reductase cytochrome b subunit